MKTKELLAFRLYVRVSLFHLQRVAMMMIMEDREAQHQNSNVVYI